MNLKLLVLILSVTCLHAQIDGRVTLQWDYPPEDMTGMTFRVYHAADIASPNWQVVTSVEATNRVALTVQPGRNYFFCTASNFWGESEASNVAASPALPRNINSLSIRRGH